MAWIAKLMGLAIVLNIASCSCDKDNKDALKIKLTAKESQQITVASGSTSGTVDTELTVKLEEGAKELDLEKIKLKVEKTAAYRNDDASGAEDGDKDEVKLESKGSDPNGQSLKDLLGKDKLKKSDHDKVKIKVTLADIGKAASAKIKFALEKDGKKIEGVEDVVVTYTTN
ncbi:MAG: hypothetical protein AAF392_02755 [Bacteroidota bacterium]